MSGSQKWSSPGATTCSPEGALAGRRQQVEAESRLGVGGPVSLRLGTAGFRGWASGTPRAPVGSGPGAAGRRILAPHITTGPRPSPGDCSSLDSPSPGSGGWWAEHSGFSVRLPELGLVAPQSVCFSGCAHRLHPRGSGVFLSRTEPLRSALP